MTVRLAKLNRLDVDNLYKLNKESLPVYYSKVEHMDYIIKIDHCVCLVENKKGIVGYCIAHHHSDDRFHIISIAVDKAERRKGYGLLLVKFLINEVKKNFKMVKRVTLFVMESNKVARNFYKKMDFNDRKVMKDYYGSGENGIMLEKNII